MNPQPATPSGSPADAVAAARAAAAAVVDPELRVVTIEELGILRDVRVESGTGRVTVTITPTYSGCPAMEVIRRDILAALAAAGYPDAEVETVLAPAWSTDWISDAGRAKLAEAGIVPPGPASGPVPLGLPRRRPPAVACPRCGATDTEELSRFGATACKALWRCTRCAEPFEYLKAI